jgi:hypothetical protein
MRIIDAAHGKLQCEQTICSDQVSWQELCPVPASNSSAITEDKPELEQDAARAEVAARSDRENVG